MSLDLSFDPLATPAKRSQISARRDELEKAPLTVGGHLIDVDDLADKRMSETLAAWDALGLTSVDWTLADNTVQAFDKAGLQALYDAMRVARAGRALQLHQKAAAFKAEPATTLRDIEPVNWL